MVRALAALLFGACAWSLARRLSETGGEPAGGAARDRWRWRRGGGDGGPAGFQIWLSQAGAAVTPGQFWAVSGGVALAAFVVLLAVARAPFVALPPALACGALPYAYWSSQRRKQAAARSAAWPDALRYLVGVLGAGISTLHEALDALSRTGPAPLRAPMARYVRISGRAGHRQALETVRSELADPISDPVLLAFAGAMEEGTDTVLRVLGDLASQITSDIQLGARIVTLQTQSRLATWGCFALPYVLLVFLCASNSAYRQFFAGPLGLALVTGGASMSAVGLAISRRLVRPVPTAERVFVAKAVPWGR